MNMMTILQGKRCTLTSIFSEDASMLLELMDEDFRYFLPEFHEVFRGRKGIERFIESFRLYESDGFGYLYGIRDCEKLIGFVAIMDIPFHSTLFYALHPDYRRQGIMTDAVAAVVKSYENRNKDVPLYTEVYCDNTASLKLLSRISCVNVTKKNRNKYT